MNAFTTPRKKTENPCAFYSAIRAYIAHISPVFTALFYKSILKFNHWHRVSQKLLEFDFSHQVGIGIYNSPLIICLRDHGKEHTKL